MNGSYLYHKGCCLAQPTAQSMLRSGTTEYRDENRTLPLYGWGGEITSLNHAVHMEPVSMRMIRNWRFTTARRREESRRAKTISMKMGSTPRSAPIFALRPAWLSRKKTRSCRGLCADRSPSARWPGLQDSESTPIPQFFCWAASCRIWGGMRLRPLPHQRPELQALAAE